MDVELDQQIVEKILAFGGAAGVAVTFLTSPLHLVVVLQHGVGVHLATLSLPGANAAVVTQLDHPVADPHLIARQRRRRRAPQYLC
jgi:hypothetical protein